MDHLVPNGHTHERRHKKRAGVSFGALVGSVVMAVALAGCGTTTASNTTATTAAAAPSGSTVNVQLTASGCTASATQVPAGNVTFNILNTGTNAVTEMELHEGNRIVAEREGITSGTSGSFSATINPGAYSLYCPGGSGPSSLQFVATS